MKDQIQLGLDGTSPIGIGHPLLQILENDYIYPPSIFIRAIEAAWKAWRDNTLKDKKVEAEFIQLCEWVNKASRRKPRTKFWRSIF